MCRRGSLRRVNPRQPYCCAIMHTDALCSLTRGNLRPPSKRLQLVSCLHDRSSASKRLQLVSWPHDRSCALHRYPYQACELFSLPHNLPLDLEGKGPLFSSASHGFLPKTYFGNFCPASANHVGRSVTTSQISRKGFQSNCIADKQSTFLGNIPGGHTLSAPFSTI